MTVELGLVETGAVALAILFLSSHGRRRDKSNAVLHEVADLEFERLVLERPLDLRGTTAAGQHEARQTQQENR